MPEGSGADAAAAVVYRGRFAPSPSGWLHLGNARTALFAWVRARLNGGAFVMRVEDLDAQRSRPDAVLGNLAELRWLGLDWDEGPDLGGPYAPYLQSRRSELYRSALERLAAAGHLFESYLTRRELSADTAASGAACDATEAGDAVYGPHHRRADEALRDERRAAGRTPSLRFRSPPGKIAFSDLIAGPQSYDAERAIGDFVVRRADGLFAYQLAVVVDDAAMGITEVARGADLLPSTAAQLLLYDALGLGRPTFAHVGLLLDPDGQKLSKRHGPTSLRELEAAGLRAQRVLGLLAASLGWLREPVELEAGELLEVGVANGALPQAQASTYRLREAELAWLYG